MGGNRLPYDKGQSGTAKPEPVLVTSPPTKIKKSVEKQTSFEKKLKKELGFLKIIMD